MHGKHRTAVALLAVVAVLVVPAAAAAHTVSFSPLSGDVASTFRFNGTGWQPGQRVVVSYFRSTTASASKTFAFLAGANGRFRFSFVQPVPLNDVGSMQRLCFAQVDTRFGRTFRSCGTFYVAPPTASYQPSSGRAGDRFALVAQGFPAGATLSVTVTFPSGQQDTFLMTTVTRPTFVDGAAGPILLPRGGAIHVVTATNSGAGYYIAEVRGPGGLVALAATRLL
jgi:hypothetical protein